MKNVPKTIDEFKARVTDILAKEPQLQAVHHIYAIFNDEISDELRGEIYAYGDNDSPEPFREAMFKMGFTWW